MPPTTKTVTGTINATPCPHCGHACDFRDLNSQQLLDTGNTMQCERCKRIMQVVRIVVVTTVTVRQAGRGAPTPVNTGARLPPARQATTLGPKATRRLLRGG